MILFFINLAFVVKWAWLSLRFNAPQYLTSLYFVINGKIQTVTFINVLLA